MARQVNIYEAKAQFSRLVDEVEAGAEIVIARNGRPVARMVPLQRPPFDRTPGSLRGLIWISPNRAGNADGDGDLGDLGDLDGGLGDFGEIERPA